MEKLLALFKLKEHGTDVKTEVIAGITTFLSMAYILAVNPSMLAAAGMDQGAVFTRWPWPRAWGLTPTSPIPLCPWWPVWA